MYNDHIKKTEEITKDRLYQIYKIEKKQLKEIASFFKVPIYTIRNRLIKYDIIPNKTYTHVKPRIGDKFNRWKVIEYCGYEDGNEYCLCECDCGTIKKVEIWTLKHGITKSCGCYHAEILKKINWTGYKEISGKYWGSLQSSGRRKRLEFNINIKYCWGLYIKQDRKCALSGLPIEFETLKRRKKDKFIASLDRIDSKKGYIVGNVQWVVKEINYMKRILTDEKFIFFCKKIAKNNK